MSNWFPGEAVRPVARDLVQVEVLGQVVKPDDGDDRERVQSHKNGSPDLDKCVLFFIADPKFLAQLFLG